MFKFGKKSEENLKGVHPELVRLHRKVLEKYDHSIDDGIRDIEEQKKYIAKGVSQTLNSKHLPQEDGLSHATDSRPYPHPDWDKIEKCLSYIRQVDPNLDILRFYHYQGYVKGVADTLDIPIRQGIDWDRDNALGDQKFFDLPHNELIHEANK